MKKNKFKDYFCIGILTVLSSICFSQIPSEKAKFKFDHIVIFCADSEVENKLQENLLKVGEKLSTKHNAQGTQGRYFIFYNSFIEFLYLEDSIAVKKNETRFKSNYSERWKNNNSWKCWS